MVFPSVKLRFHLTQAPFIDGSKYSTSLRRYNAMGISNIKLTVEIIAYKLFYTVFKITDNTLKSYMQT